MLRFIRLFESADTLESDYTRVREDVEEEWRSGQRHQSWTLVPKTKLIRLYNENGKYGRINEDILLDVWSILHDCALKVILNSETRHHDEWPYGDEPDLYRPSRRQVPTAAQPEFNLGDPVDDTPEEMGEKQVDKIRDKAWSRWFLFVSDLTNSPYVRNFGEVKGNARYSDASRSLYTLLRAGYSAQKPEAKLLAVDRIFNFAHGLGKMAKWFVEGGVDTLNKIADFAPKGITAGGLR